MKVTIITGATSAGKSSLALEVAKTLKNVEIVSADAFQVYIGFDIGTAKVTQEERFICPHHLIDINKPDQVYTAGLFVEAAEKLIGEISSRGNIPLIVGGTGLYVKTLTDGIFNCPPIDENIRPKIVARAEKEGLKTLYKELEQIDPVYANRISENDPVRIIRALEVCYGLSMPFTEAHKLYHKTSEYTYSIFAPQLERSLLYEGINTRVKAMWQAGWVQEVERLLAEGVKEDCPAFRAIGYKNIIGFLQGKTRQEETIAKIAQETRHFAKRQTTWFKSMDNISFYDDKRSMLHDVLANMMRWRIED